MAFHFLLELPRQNALDRDRFDFLVKALFDQKIIDWSNGVADDWLAADLTYFSGATGREWTRPRWMLVTHMFNHQTHHRGQAHALLTAAGEKTGDTDLAFILPLSAWS